MPADGTSLPATAKALGFSAQAFRDWRKKYTDAPEGNDLEDWRAFIVRHQLGQGNNRAHLLGDRSLKDRLTLSQIRLNEAKLAKEEARVIPAELVNDFLLHLASRWKSGVYQRFVTELPPKVAGLEPAQIHKIAQELADALILSLHDTIDAYIAEQAKQKKPNESGAENAQ